MISFIVPAHGRQELLRRCLRSLKRQNCDKEIIVVDDGSTPPLHFSDPDIRVLRLDKKGGASGARNYGASQAIGEILFFVDSDVVLLPLQRFEFPSDVDCLMGIYSRTAGFQNFSSRYKNLYWSFNQEALSENSFSLCTAILAVRKSVFDGVGGFNTRSSIGEDREFGIALKKFGARTKIEKQVRGIHHKKFGLRDLLRHHFINAQSLAKLLLRALGAATVEEGSGEAHNRQRFSIILSPMILGLFAMNLIYHNKCLSSLLIASIGLFLALIWPFFHYCFKEGGFIFSIFCVFTYALECFVASLGLAFGSAIYLLGNKDLRWENSNASGR